MGNTSRTDTSVYIPLFDRFPEGATRSIMTQREEILTAFIAKYGCDPSKIEQVMEFTHDKVIWYIRKK